MKTNVSEQTGQVRVVKCIAMELRCEHLGMFRKCAETAVETKEITPEGLAQIARCIPTMDPRTMKLAFIVVSVLLFDRWAMELNLPLKKGLREHLAKELKLSPKNVSELVSYAKTHYYVMRSYKKIVYECLIACKSSY